MITSDEACKIIKAETNFFCDELVKKKIKLKDNLAESNVYLAENILAQRDQPPFDRVAMDGIAIKRGVDLNYTQFQIENTQKAGEARKSLQSSKACLEVMTGAILPKGTNTVIPYEKIKIENNIASFLGDINNTGTIVEQIEANKNIHYKGSDFKQGEVLLQKGTKLNPASMNLCLSQGYDSIEIYEMKPIAIISTGDELVDGCQNILDYQIRKTNVYLIESILKSQFPNTSVVHYHLQDNKNEIYNKLKNILEESKIIILTGGVSKGKFDFIPSVLADLNVLKLFHKIKQRPGKPMWFGKGNKGQLIFALPGNPTSSAICFRRYTLEFIKEIHNKESESLDQNEQMKYNQSAILDKDITFKKDFTYFCLVKIHYRNGGLIATPVASNGSGDLNALGHSDGFIELPRNKELFKIGESFLYYGWSC